MKKSNKIISAVLSSLLVTMIVLSIIFLPSFICVQTKNYIYQSPEDVNDGLDIGSLDEVNIESTMLEKKVKEVLCGVYSEVHAMLIFKDNMLVFEEYFTGHKW